MQANVIKNISIQTKVFSNELMMLSSVNQISSGSKHSAIWCLNIDKVRDYQNVKKSVTLMIKNFNNGLINVY
jgi:hypothetical protein